jgi:8-oxo-dGTP pyrophosphatase MutT (NUDIX family)
MRKRPSARLLLLDNDDRVLLFRFAFPDGRVFWATPGGAVDEGESFAEAARRELLEETGIAVEDVGSSVHTRHTSFQAPDGETVSAEEHYFLVRTTGTELSQTGWTPLERQIMTEHRWWTLDELTATTETVFPEEFVALLRRLSAL